MNPVTDEGVNGNKKVVVDGPRITAQLFGAQPITVIKRDPPYLRESEDTARRKSNERRS